MRDTQNRSYIIPILLVLLIFKLGVWAGERKALWPENTEIICKSAGYEKVKK